MAIFFNYLPTSNHLHLLQVENCGSNSRLVVNEDDNGKLRLQRFKACFDKIVFGRCSANLIMLCWRCLFFINTITFYHLKLGISIALAIPASNK